MAYPPLIYLSDKNETDLKVFLQQELLTHYAERSNYVSDLERYMKVYWAKAPDGELTFPFKGASNLIIPLTAIAVEAIHAKEMTTLFGLDQFVTVKLVDEFDFLDKPIERYLDWETLQGMQFRDKIEGSLLEKTKLGTCIGKVSWEQTVKTIVQDGKEMTIVTKQGNELYPVPLANFLMPFSCQDPQTAPWVGEEHTGVKHEIQALVDSGLFYKDTMQKLDAWALANTQASLSSFPYTQTVREKQDQVPAWPKIIGWCELWLAWDTNGTGSKKEIVCYYHRLSNTILGIRYNWFNDQRRPYRHAVHVKLEHRWNGIGLTKMQENFQEEVTLQHRQRIDNATIANMRMFKVKRGSNISQGEPLFPGKMFFVDDVDDIEPMQVFDVYQSAYANEQQTLFYAQQSSGVNELNSGMPSVGTPDTATSNMIRVQEGNKKFDYTFRNTRDFVDSLIVDTVCNISQFGHRNVRYFDFVAEGQALQEFFKLPVTLLREQIVAKFTTAGAQQNKILDRNSWTQLGGVLQQYYSGMMQIAQMTGNQQLMQQIAMVAMAGSTEAVKQILESFDVRNIDRITLAKLFPNYGTQSGFGNIGAMQGIGGPQGIPVPPQIPASTQGISPAGTSTIQNAR